MPDFFGFKPKKKKDGKANKSVVNATIQLASRLRSANSMEEKVNISSGLSVLSVAANADDRDAFRLISVAKNIAKPAKGGEKNGT